LAFALPALYDLRTGRVTISARIYRHDPVWSHEYAFQDHPVYFALKVLMDVSGAVAIGGIGLLLLYVAVRQTLDPSGVRVSPLSRRIATVWGFICVASGLLFLILKVFPFLLVSGILS
jgi:hypothetical protein